MLTVSGVLVVPSDATIQEGTDKFNNHYFRLTCATKSSAPSRKKEFYDVVISASPDQAENVKKFLAPQQHFILRFGELQGTKSDTGYVSTRILVKWYNILPIYPAFTKEKKEME